MDLFGEAHQLLFGHTYEENSKETEKEEPRSEEKGEEKSEILENKIEL
jgi:hypothetical protein